MMLGGRHYVEADIVGELRELAQLVEHLLVALVVAPDRAKPLAVLERPGNRRQNEKHELHRFLLLIPSCFVVAQLRTTLARPTHRSAGGR